MIDLLAVQNPFTLKLALFVGAFLFAASAALVRPSIVQPLLTSIQNSPGIMHATAAVTAFAGGGLLVAHLDFSSITASKGTLQNMESLLRTSLPSGCSQRATST